MYEESSGTDDHELGELTCSLDSLRSEYERLMTYSIYSSEACKSLREFATMTPGCFSVPKDDKTKGEKSKKTKRPLTKLTSIFRSKSTDDFTTNYQLGPTSLTRSCDAIQQFESDSSDSEYEVSFSRRTGIPPSKSCPDNLSSLLKDDKFLLQPRTREDEGECYMESVPEEILYEIFYYLDFRSLIACSLVCKLWALILQSQPITKNPLKRWDWVNIIYFNKNYLNRYYGDPLVRGHFYGANIWTQKPSNAIADIFKKNVSWEHKQNKIIERDIENSRFINELTIIVPLLGDTQGRHLFRGNMMLHAGDCEITSSTALTEYKCWFNSKNKTPLKLVEFSKHNGTLRSKKKFHHMFAETVAIVVSYDLGQYDSVYIDSSGRNKGLLFHKLYRSLKDTLRLKSFSGASVILFLFKGNFETKIKAALESGDVSRDISLLFPEYQAHQSPEDQLEYFISKIIGWCSSRKRNRSVSKYVVARESDPQMVGVLHDTVRHSVIQKRAYKLGLGTI